MLQGARCIFGVQRYFSQSWLQCSVSKRDEQSREVSVTDTHTHAHTPREGERGMEREESEREEREKREG